MPRPQMNDFDSYFYERGSLCHRSFHGNRPRYGMKARSRASPNCQHDAEEWQAAMEALIMVAEHDGPTMFARIGVMRALNRHVERVFDPSRKDKHWGRRKLARDQ